MQTRLTKVIILGLLLGAPAALFAQAFVPLTTIPGITDFTNASSLVNGIIRIVIVAGALMAVVQIIRGGFTYITTEAVSSKGDAKQIIQDALTGLLLILSSVLILTIINPDILNVRFFNNDRTRVGSDPLRDEEMGSTNQIREVGKNESCPDIDGYSFAGEARGSTDQTKSCVFVEKISLKPISNVPRPTEIAPNASGDGVINRVFIGGCPSTVTENGITFGYHETLGKRRGDVSECTYRQLTN